MPFPSLGIGYSVAEPSSNSRRNWSARNTLGKLLFLKSFGNQRPRLRGSAPPGLYSAIMAASSSGVNSLGTGNDTASESLMNLFFMVRLLGYFVSSISLSSSIEHQCAIEKVAVFEVFHGLFALGFQRIKINERDSPGDEDCFFLGRQPSPFGTGTETESEMLTSLYSMKASLRSDRSHSTPRSQALATPFRGGDITSSSPATPSPSHVCCRGSAKYAHGVPTRALPASSSAAWARSLA